MRRATRIGLVVAGLAGLQLAALLVFRAVERGRTPAAPFATERLSGSEPAPVFAARRADGAPVSVAAGPARLRVVHFWATWCAPCRDELPGLLRATRPLRDRGVEVVAIAVDDDWADIRRFFAGRIPPEIVIADDPGAHRRYGVSTLPDTYLVDRDGRLVERVRGARDWTGRAARDHLAGLLAPR